MLNVTPEDLLNGLRIAHACAAALMRIYACPIRVLEVESDTDEKDFRFDYLDQTWKPMALVEAKARKFYDPPLVSKRKIDAIWQQCIAKQVTMIVALWFDDHPDVIYWREVDQDYLDWAAKRIQKFGHGKRAAKYREAGYPFPREHMNKCYVFAKRLKSVNSDL